MVSINSVLMRHLEGRDDLPLPRNLKGGVLVPRVMPHSPASAGGLRGFDVIVEVNGHAVQSISDVLEYLGDNFEDGVEVKVLRGLEGQKLTLRLVPTVMPPGGAVPQINLKPVQ